MTYAYGIVLATEYSSGQLLQPLVPKIVTGNFTIIEKGYGEIQECAHTVRLEDDHYHFRITTGRFYPYFFIPIFSFTFFTIQITT